MLFVLDSSRAWSRCLAFPTFKRTNTKTKTKLKAPSLSVHFRTVLRTEMKHYKHLARDYLSKVVFFLLYTTMIYNLFVLAPNTFIEVHFMNASKQL